MIQLIEVTSTHGNSMVIGLGTVAIIQPRNKECVEILLSTGETVFAKGSYEDFIGIFRAANLIWDAKL